MVYFDAVVVGGGNVGLAFILAFGKEWRQSCRLAGKYGCRRSPRVLLLERQGRDKWPLSPLRVLDSSSPPLYSNRVSALTPKSIEFLQRLGVWQRIEETRRFQPFSRMQVWQAELGKPAFSSSVVGASQVVFDAKDVESDALAVILENNVLQKALLDELMLSSSVDDGAIVMSFDDQDTDFPDPPLKSNRNAINVTALMGFQSDSIQLARDPVSSLIKLQLKTGDGKPFECETAVIVGSDGAGNDNSPIKRFSGISCIQKDYDQVGIVATLSHLDQPEPLTAYQRFLATGPIALLPLNVSTSSMVWTVPSKIGKKLVSLAGKNPKLFEMFIQSAFLDHQSDVSYRLGILANEEDGVSLDQLESSWLKDRSTIEYQERSNASHPSLVPPSSYTLKPVNSVQSFPLKLRHCVEYDKRRVVLIGDAAHSIHPLAGQGLNLGLSDADTLASVLIHYYTLNQDIGLDFVLAEYSKRQMASNLLMQMVCHTIQGFYDDDRDCKGDLGMTVRVKQELASHLFRMVDSNPFGLKKAIMQVAMKSTTSIKELS